MKNKIISILSNAAKINKKIELEKINRIKNTNFQIINMQLA